MNDFNYLIRMRGEKSILGFISSIFGQLRIAIICYLSIYVFALCLRFSAPLYAQGSIDMNDATAVTSGSIRQRELLAFKNEEIIRLRKELIAAEEKIDLLQFQLQSQDDQPSGGEQNSASDSIPVNDLPPDTVSGPGEYISLGNRWFVRVSSTGPENYMDLMKARQIQHRLPNEADCENLSAAFGENSELLAKLAINGFPVTNFWVLRSNGKIGVCRINRVSSQRFRATIASTTPSRSDKAIALDYK